MCALDWSDIDWEQRTVTVNKSRVRMSDGTYITKTPKTSSGFRIIPVGQKTLDLLKKYRSIGKIFTSGTDYMHTEYLTEIFKIFIDKNKLKHTTLHGLRHYNATLMLLSGIPDKVAASRLGHSDTNMTKKYQYVLEEQNREVADTIEKKLFKSVQ